MKAVRLHISGRVQGVWYRAWTLEEARQRGLDGWVRNRSDGSVEALLAGPAPRVDELVQACWQGPPAARVTAVVATPASAPQESGFHKRPTL